MEEGEGDGGRHAEREGGSNAGESAHAERKEEGAEAEAEEEEDSFWEALLHGKEEDLHGEVDELVKHHTKRVERQCLARMRSLLHSHLVRADKDGREAEHARAVASQIASITASLRGSTAAAAAAAASAGEGARPVPSAVAGALARAKAAEEAQRARKERRGWVAYGRSLAPKAEESPNAGLHKESSDDDGDEDDQDEDEDGDDDGTGDEAREGAPSSPTAVRARFSLRPLPKRTRPWEPWSHRPVPPAYSEESGAEEEPPASPRAEAGEVRVGSTRYVLRGNERGAVAAASAAAQASVAAGLARTARTARAEPRPLRSTAAQLAPGVMTQPAGHARHVDASLVRRLNRQARERRSAHASAFAELARRVDDKRDFFTF